ncbi:MAG: MgtC/SapB family protein [Chloroflexota bacterium]
MATSTVAPPETPPEDSGRRPHPPAPAAPPRHAADRGALVIVIGLAIAALLVVVLVALPGSRPHMGEPTPLPDNEFTRILDSVRSMLAPTSNSLPVVLGKLVLAALLGGIIGYRQRLHAEEYIVQAHVIIAFTGALMMIIIGNELVRAFGLLGAGSIVRYRTPVRDPKALASLFVTMAVGLAVGTGLYELALVGGLLIVGLQGLMGTVVGLLPPTLYNPQRGYVLALHTEDGPATMERLKHTFAERDIRYRLLEYDMRGGKKDLVKLSLKVEAGAAYTTEELTLLVLRDGVRSASWEEEG